MDNQKGFSGTIERIDYMEDLFKVRNLVYRDPDGNPASAYIVRAFFSDGTSSCANTLQDAFDQCRKDRDLQSEKWFPSRVITGMELESIDGGLGPNGEPLTFPAVG